MPVSRTVSEHMRPIASYPHIDANATLRDVFVMLRERYNAAEQFRSVLVFDQQQHLIGKLSLHNLFYALLPEYLVGLPAHYAGGDNDLSTLALLWQDDCARHCRLAAQQRVADHVKPVASPLAADDPLALALYRFATSDFNVIPVAEGERIIGVLRIVDVLAAVVQTILTEDETP